MNVQLRNIVSVVTIGMFWTSCSYFQPSVMFKTPKEYKFSDYIDSVRKEYILRENDVFTLNLYSNDGFRLIDINNMLGSGSGSSNISMAASGVEYVINANKYVRLPVIDTINITGMTIRQAELFLQKRYSEFYNSPYVLLEVINKRVIVFPGAEGAAKVLPLQNQNTTLIEALALAGGISEAGRARKVKLIRQYEGSQQVYRLDLSTIEGIKEAGLTLQANDIIYVEPIFRPSQEFFQELAPIVSLLTTTITLLVTINILKNQ